MTSIVLLSKNAARELTTRIQRAGTDFAALILEAHDGEAWRALGYATWDDYVEHEFEFKRAQSYQLLDRGRAEKQLSEAAGVPIRVSQRDAPIVRKAPQVVDAVRQAAARGDEPSAAYLRAVEEQRRSMPDPKPRAKRGGYVPPVERLRLAFRLIIDVNEQMEAEDSLPTDLERTAQNALLALRGMLHA